MALHCKACVRLVTLASLARVHAVHEADCGGEAAPSTQLLQTEFGLGGAAAGRLAARRAAQAPDPLEEADWAPLYWMHVAKCGSSFGNSFFHVPGACSSVPEDFAWMGKWGAFEGLGSVRCHNLDLEGFGGHWSVSTNYDTLKGHMATMLRNPSQRVLSSWYYEVSMGSPEVAGFGSVAEFAEKNQGILTKMLTQDGEFKIGGEGRPVTEADALLAAERIREGFLFVGMLEDWDNSICLFNLMFNFDCYPLQFLETNARSENSSASIDDATGLYDESPLEGFFDKYDAVPYLAGKELYEETFAKYDDPKGRCGACFSFKGQPPPASLQR